MTGSFLFSNVKINNNGAKASFDRRADVSFVKNHHKYAHQFCLIIY